MAKSVDEQIQELNDAKSKRAELRGVINTCNLGIALLRKECRRTKKDPRVDITVKDDYSDDDYWAYAGLTLYKLPNDLIETLVGVFEAEKQRQQAELNKLESKYTF